MHRYAVTYKPAAGHLTVWLVIENVPADVEPAAVEEALQGWRQWPEWMRRVGLGGTVHVRQLTGQLARRIGTEPAGAQLIEWSQLVPESRTLTVPLPGDLYGILSRQARGRGLSLREWSTRVLAYGVEQWEAIDARGDE